MVAKLNTDPPMPTTDCIAQVRFDFHPNRAIDVSFNAPELSSDGGVLLLRELDGKLGLCSRVAGLLRDERCPDRVVEIWSRVVFWRSARAVASS